MNFGNTINHTQPQTIAGRKGVWGWMLFDWATQPYHTLLLTFIFGPYFVSHVAADKISGQAQWGYAITIAGLIIAILSPVLGAISDALGSRKPWIFIFSVIGVSGSFLLWWAVPYSESSNSVFIALLGIITMMVGYELATVFNNAMMPNLVSREKLGRLSGNAWALGYVGGLLTLIFVVLFLTTNSDGKTLLGADPLFGMDPALKEGERSTGPLASVWYALFIIPFFMFTSDRKSHGNVLEAAKHGLFQLRDTVISLPRKQSLFVYLCSSMFYRDALNGLYFFGGIYASGVMGWSITEIGIFGILANITGIFGAYIGGRIDDRQGPKFVITGCIVLLTAASLIIVSTNANSVFFLHVEENSLLPDLIYYICGCAIGAAGGALQAASRTLMTDQAEPGKTAEAFGLYALSGRATAFLAPLMIALFTDISGSQRIGISPIIVLFLISLALLPMVKERCISA